MIIPEIIHQTYKDINHKYILYSKKWKYNNNHWKYNFYNDTDINTFINKYSSEIDKDFNGNIELLKYIKKCSKIELIDIFRYLLMYYVGGIYADIDTNCFKPFNYLCKNEECIFGIESYITHQKKKKLDYKFNYTLGNAILISTPKHPIFKEIIENILNNKYPVSIEQCETEYIVQKTGPGLITKTIQNYLYSKEKNNCFIRDFMYKNHKIKIMEQIYFYPPTLPPIYNFYPFNINIYSNHVCQGSWKISKKNNYSTMDFIPYPWLWMYKYRIDYIFSIISLLPLLKSSEILIYDYQLQSLMIFLTFISAFIYHTNEYLGLGYYNLKIGKWFHIIDNITAYNTLIIMYLIKQYKNDIILMNIYTIIMTFISSIYQTSFYSQPMMETLIITPFLFLMKEYYLQYPILIILTLITKYLGSKEFDYFSSRKYHSLWHFFSSMIIYNIISDLI